MDKIKKSLIYGLVFGLFAGVFSPSLINIDNNIAIAQEESIFLVTVEHSFGKTTVKSKPERIVTIGRGNDEVALSLGVAPVLIPKANWGSNSDKDLLPWVEDKYQELGVEPKTYSDLDGYNYEAIAAAEPDIILAANSGLTEEDYQQMSQIAPTVAYPGQAWQTNWRDNIKISSKAMGLEKEGLDLIGEIEAMLKEEVAKRPELKGKTAAFLNIKVEDLSEFSIYTPSNSRGIYLSEFGLGLPDEVKELTDSTDDFYLKIGAEEAYRLDNLDIIVSYGSEDDLKTIQAHPIMGKIPAIKRGSVVMLSKDDPMRLAANPSALSIQKMTGEYLDRLVEASKKLPD